MDLAKVEAILSWLDLRSVHDARSFLGLCSYYKREFGKSLCLSCRSYSNSVRPFVQLHNSVTKAELFLVGIDHVSPKSAKFVQHVIRELTPNVVAVELCMQRSKALLCCREQKSMTWNEFWALKGGLGQKIVHFIINEIYAQLAAKGLKPGDEFRVAILEGSALGAKVICMDQDMDVTLKRVSQEFSLLELIRVLLRRKEIVRQFPYLYKVFSLSDQDPIQLIDAMMHPKAREEAMEFGEKYLPGLVKSLVHERNDFMVRMLREMSGNIVAVVGALHLEGMHKLWKEAELRPP